MINENTREKLAIFALQAGYGRNKIRPPLRGYHDAGFMTQFWNTNHVIIKPLTRLLTIGSIIFLPQRLPASLIPFSVEFASENTLSLYPLLKMAPLKEVNAVLCAALFNAYAFHMISQLSWKLLISAPWHKVTGDIMDIRHDITANEHPDDDQEYKLKDLRQVGSRILTQHAGNNFTARYYALNYILPLVALAPAVLAESLAANWMLSVVKEKDGAFALGVPDIAYYVGVAACVSILPMAMNLLTKNRLAKRWANTQLDEINTPANTQGDDLEEGLIKSPVSDEFDSYPDYYTHALKQEAVKGSFGNYGYEPKRQANERTREDKKESVDITLPADPFVSRKNELITKLSKVANKLATQSTRAKRNAIEPDNTLANWHSTLTEVHPLLLEIHTFLETNKAKDLRPLEDRYISSNNHYAQLNQRVQTEDASRATAGKPSISTLPKPSKFESAFTKQPAAPTGREEKRRKVFTAPPPRLSQVQRTATVTVHTGGVGQTWNSHEQHVAPITGNGATTFTQPPERKPPPRTPTSTQAAPVRRAPPPRTPDTLQAGKVGRPPVPRSNRRPVPPPPRQPKGDSALVPTAPPLSTSYRPGT